MYCSVKTQFKDPDALVRALMETGEWQGHQIEVHDEPQHLYGYHGDVREQVANIIVRRQYVQASANDIGFEKTVDGTYRSHISQFDSNKYNSTWMGRLRQSYAFHVLKRQQEARGRTVTREKLPDGRQRVMIRGYR
jgi:hypothetical protein